MRVSQSLSAPPLSPSQHLTLMITSQASCSPSPLSVTIRDEACSWVSRVAFGSFHILLHFPLVPAEAAHPPRETPSPAFRPSHAIASSHIQHRSAHESAATGSDMCHIHGINGCHASPSRRSSCDADYILMLDGVMEYNHASLQLATGRGPATAPTLLHLLSSPLSALLLCTGEFHFILRFQSGFRLCEYSTDRSCSPTRLPDHPPAPPYPLYPPPFTLQPPSSPPPPPRGHGPVGCPCALARWRRVTVS